MAEMPEPRILWNSPGPWDAMPPGTYANNTTTTSISGYKVSAGDAEEAVVVFKKGIIKQTYKFPEVTGEINYESFPYSRGGYGFEYEMTIRGGDFVLIEEVVFDKKTIRQTMKSAIEAGESWFEALAELYAGASDGVADKAFDYAYEVDEVVVVEANVVVSLPPTKREAAKAEKKARKKAEKAEKASQPAEVLPWARYLVD